MDLSNNHYIPEGAVTAPLGALREGRLGAPRTITGGGQKHIVDIQFTGRPVVGDTLTINGVTWTFIANGGSPAGNEIALGTTLATDLDAMIAALNGSADGDVAAFTYTEDGSDTLTATADANAAYTDDAFAADVDAGATVTVADDGRTDTEITNKTCNIALKTDLVSQNQAFTLADGMEFELKSIVATGTPGGNFVITPDNIDGGTTLTFDADGEYAVMQFLGGSWRVLAAADGVLG
jgi:hypothetical protein